MNGRREQETLDEVLKLVQQRSQDKSSFDPSRGGSGRTPTRDQEPLDASSKSTRPVNHSYLPSLPPIGRLRFSNRAWWSNGTITAGGGEGPSESGEIVRHIVSAVVIGFVDDRATNAGLPTGVVNQGPIDGYSGQVFVPPVNNPSQ
ncbi:hypothetical protein ACUXK4_004539 [Methylorubrum extorquens]